MYRKHALKKECCQSEKCLKRVKERRIMADISAAAVMSLREKTGLR